MIATCYMCAVPAVNREHAPPSCIFPEAKDLPAGSADLRRNLITVPSCADHNPRTSKDDEYFFVVVASMFQGNHRSEQQFVTKVIRALARRAPFAQRVFGESTPALVDGLPSIGFPVDRGRIERIVDKIARAIYYEHTVGEKLTRLVRVLLPAFAHGSEEADSAFARLHELAERFFGEKNVPWLGENADVFSYRIHVDQDGDASFLGLRFYGGVDFIVVWGRQFDDVQKLSGIVR